VEAASRLGARDGLLASRPEERDGRTLLYPPAGGVDPHDVTSRTAEVEVDRAFVLRETHVDRAGRGFEARHPFEQREDLAPCLRRWQRARLLVANPVEPDAEGFGPKAQDVATGALRELGKGIASEIGEVVPAGSGEREKRLRVDCRTKGHWVSPAGGEVLGRGVVIGQGSGVAQGGETVME
jgi:hypothetical protein